MCLPSVYLTSPHVTKISQAFPSILAHHKGSKAGGEPGNKATSFSSLGVVIRVHGVAIHGLLAFPVNFLEEHCGHTSSGA